jgi:hypothetical protein
MDLHIKKFKEMEKKGYKKSSQVIELEENKSLKQPSSYKQEVDITSTKLNILRNKNIEMIVDPFKRETKSCQYCFRILCAVTIVMVSIVIITIIVYN